MALGPDSLLYPEVLKTRLTCWSGLTPQQCGFLGALALKVTKPSPAAKQIISLRMTEQGSKPGQAGSTWTLLPRPSQKWVLVEWQCPVVGSLGQKAVPGWLSSPRKEQALSAVSGSQGQLGLKSSVTTWQFNSHLWSFQAKSSALKDMAFHDTVFFSPQSCPCLCSDPLAAGPCWQETH